MKIALFGASGLAAETAELCRELGCERIVFIGLEASRPHRSGIEIVPEADAYDLAAAGFRFAIAIGDPLIRRRLAERFAELDFAELVHPAATLSSMLLPQRDGLRRGTIALPGARVSPAVSLGDFCVLNPNCTVAHDCELGSFVTVGPGAHVTGNVTVGDNTSIGAGAVILPGKSAANKMRIGAHAVIGAGAVVTRPVPDSRVVKGVPAR